MPDHRLKIEIGYQLARFSDDSSRARFETRDKFRGLEKKSPCFKPLKNPGYFQRFSVDGWTVVWENGADIAPETLYEIALQNKQLQAA